MGGWLSGLFLILLQGPQGQVAPTRPAPPPTPKAYVASAKELQDLSLRLRALILENVPVPLHESSPGWGQTTAVLKRGQWETKNHGKWRKVLVTANDLPQTLQFEVRRLQKPTPKNSTFDLYMAFDTRVQIHSETWRKGLRLIEGDIRARLRIMVTLSCEVHLETKATRYLLPEILFRLKVKQANVDYENLVLEHVYGLGGEGAKLIGDIAQDIVKQFKPSLEKRLLERLEKSLVKALDNKSVKVSVGKLFDKK